MLLEREDIYTIYRAAFDGEIREPHQL